METLVNFIASYGSIVMGDFLLGELLGIFGIALTLGIIIGKWIYQPKRAESRLD